MRDKRPAVLTAAIAICVVNSVGNLAAFGAPPIPRPIAYASLGLALIGVVGAFGLWRVQRWGALLSAGVLVLTAVLAAPGIAFGPILALQVVAALTVLLDIAGIALIFVPASRQAYAVHPPNAPAQSTR
jgi:hypothetical protein